MAQAVHFRAVVESVNRHSADVASYRLTAERRLPKFTPGQFIHLSLDEYDGTGFWPESRVFSVANAVSDRRTVELTISRQGRYTGRILDELKAGDAVWAKGPYGEFTVGKSGGCGRIVMVAGGTGVTPFCAFMDAALSEGELPVEEAVLYYGARSSELLIHREIAERCESRFGGFRSYLFAEFGGAERRGRLDPEIVYRETMDRADTAYYLSGPKAMIDHFRTTLAGRFGVGAERILVDAWD